MFCVPPLRKSPNLPNAIKLSLNIIANVTTNTKNININGVTLANSVNNEKKADNLQGDVNFIGVVADGLENDVIEDFND